MLLESYRKEIFRPDCNPSFQSLNCIAHLDQDIGEVLPYLNTVLGGDAYIKAPPALTFKLQGKLITLHSRKIAVNALKTPEEAEKILEWLKREINGTWEKRGGVEPSCEAAPRPQLLQILKLLPKTNCRECGQPTCMAFSALAVEGAKGVEDCPALEGPNREKLLKYLGQFNFSF